jgi:hypothetical protein
LSVGLWDEVNAPPDRRGRSLSDKTLKADLLKHFFTCPVCHRHLTSKAVGEVRVTLTKAGPLGILRETRSTQVHEACLDEARRVASDEGLTLEVG